jgi:hypothetical protein
VRGECVEESETVETAVSVGEVLGMVSCGEV